MQRIKSVRLGRSYAMTWRRCRQRFGVIATASVWLEERGVDAPLQVIGVAVAMSAALALVLKAVG